MTSYIPAIMEKSFNEAETKIKQIKDYVSWVQIDVTDNVLVEGKSFELELLERIEMEKTLLWDIHLMVKEPASWVEKCIEVGASRIIGQVEMMSDPEGFVKRIKDEGIEAGVAFDIETPVENIPEETDVVLLMGRKMGYENHEMEWQKLKDKIKKVKNLGFLPAVDGGVNENNRETLEEAGVEIIYTTGMVFQGNINENLRRLNPNADTGRI